MCSILICGVIELNHVVDHPQRYLQRLRLLHSTSIEGDGQADSHVE